MSSDTGSSRGRPVKRTVALRDRIARSKFIHEDQLATIQALKEEIVETLHQIVAKGGVDNERD